MAGLEKFAGRLVGVLGLGASGMAVARALREAGAEIAVFDDRETALADAAACGWPKGDSAAIARLDLLVASPGVPFSHPAPHPVIAKAREAGVPVTCDIQLFADTLDGPAIIGITGTNGKSTTATLVHHLLTETGRSSVLGGNIGRAVFDLEIPEEDTEPVVVLELSSFQLDLCDHLACEIAVLLNIAPDHLDRHGSLEGYIAAKKRIFEQQREDGVAVIGMDDPEARAIFFELAADGRMLVPVSGSGRIAGGIYAEDGWLVDDMAGDARPVVELAPLSRLPGRHSHQNLAAAWAVMRLLGVEPEAALAGIASFAGLAHRAQEVATLGSIRFINDSKATNIDAAVRALDAFEDIYWIAGGRAKPGGFADLLPHLGHVRRAFLIGEAAGEIASVLDGKVPFEHCGTLARATYAALALAQEEGRPAPVVLLAPACASFDQFASFVARGESFTELAKALAGEPALEGIPS